MTQKETNNNAVEGREKELKITAEKGDGREGKKSTQTNIFIAPPIPKLNPGSTSEFVSFVLAVHPPLYHLPLHPTMSSTPGLVASHSLLFSRPTHTAFIHLVSPATLFS